MNKLSTIQKRENLNGVRRAGETGPEGAHQYNIDCKGRDTHTIQISNQVVADEDLREIVRDMIKKNVLGTYKD